MRPAHPRGTARLSRSTCTPVGVIAPRPPTRDGRAESFYLYALISFAMLRSSFDPDNNLYCAPAGPYLWYVYL